MTSKQGGLPRGAAHWFYWNPQGLQVANYLMQCSAPVIVPVICEHLHMESMQVYSYLARMYGYGLVEKSRYQRRVQRSQWEISPLFRDNLTQFIDKNRWCLEC